MDPDAELVGFFVTASKGPASKGIWYTRSDVLEYVSDAELEGVLSTRKLTAHQRINVGYEDGVWQKGGHTVAYCDKMIRSAWPNLPYTRPCTVCKETKPVNEFTQSAPPKDGFAPKRPECTKCGNEAKAGSGKKAQAMAVASCSQKICANGCNDGKPKPVGCFAEGRNTCTDCRNKDAAKRNVVAAAADPNLRICSGCAVAKPPVDFARPEHKTCIGCNKKGKRYSTSEYNTLNVYLKKYKMNAKAKERQWDLTDDEAVSMFMEDCTYCGRPATFKKPNGLDRVDNNLHYAPANVASCCTTCNFIKLNLDVLTFLRRCHHIHHLNIGADSEEDYRQEWPTAYSGPLVKIASTLNEDKRLATREDKAQFKADHQLCLYCGLSSGGIDRYDACTGSAYVIGNMVPCCTECNFMKGRVHGDDFLAQCARIATHGHMHRVDEAGVVRYRIAARGFM